MPNLTVDATSKSSTEPWNHTCTGSNLILIVGFIATGGEVNPGVTYNGTAMTFIDSSANGSDVVNLYYLLNPSTGSHSIDVAIGGADFNYGFAVSYTGAKQSGQPESSSPFAGVSASYGKSLTPSLTNCWLLAMEYGALGTDDAGANTTARSTFSASSPFKKGIYDSNGPVPAGQASSLNWVTSDSLPTQYNGVIIAIAATDSVKPGNAGLLMHLSSDLYQ